ncbi:MAG TPA: hypothetical protein VM491_20080 [Burkholderiaceae bacterium]|nr:hypothetical protein [Burkholderiaceae bacterium]
MELDSVWVVLLCVGPLAACIFLTMVGIGQYDRDDEFTSWLRDSLGRTAPSQVDPKRRIV